MGNIVRPSRHKKLLATGASVVYEPFDPGTRTRLALYNHRLYNYVR